MPALVLDAYSGSADVDAVVTAFVLAASDLELAPPATIEVVPSVVEFHCGGGPCWMVTQ
jgi:hypothetical protein